METILDANELAARYGVARSTIHAWRRRGWLSAVRRPGDNRILFAVSASDRALRDHGFILPGDAGQAGQS